MKLRDLAEAAVVASAGSRHLIGRATSLRSEMLQQHWWLSRERQSRWLRALQVCSAAMPDAQPRERSVLWDQTQPVLEEIFVSEMLTRVWTATISAAFRNGALGHAEGIARSIFYGHLQARHQSLCLMLSPSISDSVNIVPLDRIRRRAERWTDVLLGQLVIRYGVSEFAFDEDRARCFGTQRSGNRVGDLSGPIWQLILSGLKLSFPEVLSSKLPNADLDRRIVAHVHAGLPESALPRTEVR